MVMATQPRSKVTVYVLEQAYPYEGSDLLSVHRSEAGAKEAGRLRYLKHQPLNQVDNPFPEWDLVSGRGATEHLALWALKLGIDSTLFITRMHVET